jgi:hypothetical protein
MSLIMKDTSHSNLTPKAKEHHMHAAPQIKVTEEKTLEHIKTQALRSAGPSSSESDSENDSDDSPDKK